MKYHGSYNQAKDSNQQKSTAGLEQCLDNLSKCSFHFLLHNERAYDTKCCGECLSKNNLNFIGH